MAGRRKKIPAGAQLGGFKLIDDFRDLLRPLDEKRVKSSRELDPRRKFDAEGYFTMMLFTLLNPVIDSMRALLERNCSNATRNGTTASIRAPGGCGRTASRA